MEHITEAGLGPRIQAAITAAGMTQASLADALGVRAPQINKIVKGRNVPQRETVDRIAAIVGVPTPVLLGEAVPVLGWVAAGNGEDEDMPPGQYVNLPDFCRRADGVYRVRGTSMKEAGILPGDYLAVRTNPAPASGEIVVAFIRDAGSVVKKLKVVDGRQVLLSEDGRTDPRYPYTIGEGDHFYGVLVASFRRYDAPPDDGRRPARGRAKK